MTILSRIENELNSLMFVGTTIVITGWAEKSRLGYIRNIFTILLIGCISIALVITLKLFKKGGYP